MRWSRVAGMAVGAYIAASCVVPNPASEQLLRAQSVGVESRMDVAYGPDGGCVGAVSDEACGGSQTFDLYPASKGDGPRPVIIYLHGGGWDGGDKRSGVYANIAEQTRRGSVVIDANYRLAPAVRFPGPLHDVKRLVRWVKVHAAELGVDARRITISGHSAGGNLASMVGVTDGQFEPPLDPSDPDDASLMSVNSSVAAVVDIAGPVDYGQFIARVPSLAIKAFADYLDTTTDAAVLKAAGPIPYVGPGDAPQYLVSGETDMITPPTDHQALAMTYVAAGLSDRMWIDVVDGEGHVPTGINQAALDAFLDLPDHISV